MIVAYFTSIVAFFANQGLINGLRPGFTLQAVAMGQKSDFSFYFFEHGYLSNALRYSYEIPYGTSSYLLRGKCVSDF